MNQTSPLTLRSWPNAIIHIDGDAFFASCEQSIHPELKGKPVITGKERNIVASMSYEAKARGVKRATPLWEARRICPNAIILPSDYETYSLISKKMFSIIRRFTADVEEYSIDEGFADLKGLRRLYHTNYTQISKQIRETIERELDIPVSLGLSLTKTLAKLASKYEKPRGFTVVSGRDLHIFLENIKVEEVCGIGSNTKALLNKQGIVTALDYAKKSESWVKSLLGKIGVELWRELRGEMVYLLDPKVKTSYGSISKSKTFTPPSSNYEYVKAQLFRNTESAFIKLRRYHLCAERLLVYLRTQDFRGMVMQGDFTRGAISPFEVFPFVEELLKSIFVFGVLYRSTGIVLACLTEDQGVQFELFEDPVRMLDMRQLASAIDEINSLYGKHTVFSGSCLFLGRLMRKNRLTSDSRKALPVRKSALLPGETFRQRLNLPMWQIKV
jgi:DNA polymerase IV